MASLKVIHDPPLKNCVNCLDEFGHCQRPAPYGLKTKPLCRTHALAKRNATRRKSHRSYVEQTYGLGAGEYDRLYEYQGGKCAICRRATGKTKNLSVDHNHRHCDQCAGKNSCGQGVRGLLCLRCNTLLGHLRDDLDAAQRIYEYLSKPPYPTMMADREYLDQLEPEHPDSMWQIANPPLVPLDWDAKWEEIYNDPDTWDNGEPLSDEEIQMINIHVEETYERRRRGEGDPLDDEEPYTGAMDEDQG